MTKKQRRTIKKRCFKQKKSKPVFQSAKNYVKEHIQNFNKKDDNSTKEEDKKEENNNNNDEKKEE